MPMLTITFRCLATGWVMFAAAAERGQDSVAVIAQLSGSATARTSAEGKPAAVHALDWIRSGTTVELGNGSRAVLILLNGHRWELRAGAKATVSGDAAKVTGDARELAALPAIPRPAAVAVESAPTAGAAAIRGGETVTGLYPAGHAFALADNLKLQFDAVAKATSYRVTMEDDAGNRLLDVKSESNSVVVPSGTAQWGSRYRWEVRALGPSGVMARGGGSFATLPAEEALRREEFATAVHANGGDAEALGLLGEVDLRLGLIAEACEEFSAALAQKPGDSDLRRALESAKASLHAPANR